MLADDIQQIFAGSDEIEQAYAGSSLVWERQAILSDALKAELRQGALVDAVAKALHPSVTYSGGTNGLCRQKDGTWIANPNPGQPRWGWSEDGTEQIVHVEAADATNLAIWPSPNGTGDGGGTATSNWNGDGTTLGLGIITNPAGTRYPRLKPTLEAATEYTISATVSGDTQDVAFTSFDDSLGWQQSPALNVTSAPKRFTWTFTTVNRHSAQGTGFRIGSVGTLHVENFQLEAGPVATSPIPTNGAPVTRAADVSS